MQVPSIGDVRSWVAPMQDHRPAVALNAELQDGGECGHDLDERRARERRCERLVGERRVSKAELDVVPPLQLRQHLRKRPRAELQTIAHPRGGGPDVSRAHYWNCCAPGQAPELARFEYHAWRGPRPRDAALDQTRGARHPALT